MLKSKLHRATVTESNLHYEGSLELDAELMAAAGILPGEKVQVLNEASGARFETYVIEGKAGSGTVCLNGPAARMGQVGDHVIVIAYVHLDPETARSFKPVIVKLDHRNRPES
jgi:aspartate 1-decarboxylase